MRLQNTTSWVTRPQHRLKKLLVAASTAPLSAFQPGRGGLSPQQLAQHTRRMHLAQPQVQSQVQQQLAAAGAASGGAHSAPQQAALLPAVPLPVPGSSSIAGPLKFTKHLSTVSNGCAPPLSRFESLGWLLFETKRLQAALLGPHAAATAHSWLSSGDSLQLLEQIYLVGSAIADLGTADGLQPLSSSNGSRAIVSLDYSRLLERYLQQHGQLLTEAFWSGLQPYDDLQVRAMHVATSLETRSVVHALLFDKLIERVGTEGRAASGAWSSSSLHGQPGGPLATAITNTMINTTQQHAAPVTTQSTVAAPNAVNSNNATSSSSSTTNNNAAAAGAPLVHGFWGVLGHMGAVFLLVCSVAGRVVQVVIAVVAFTKDLLMQLLMLRAVSAGVKAVAAKASSASSSMPQLQPAFAVAAGGNALPAAGAAAGSAYQTRQQVLPGSTAILPRSTADQPGLSVPDVTGPGAAGASAVATASPPAAAAGSLGLLSAVPFLQPDTLLQATQQRRVQQRGVQKQQQQQQLAQEPGASSWVLVQSPPTAAAVNAALQLQEPSVQAGITEKVPAAVSTGPQQVFQGGLQRGLGSAQRLLHSAATRAASAAAVIPTVLLQQQQLAQQQQQQQQQSKGPKAGRGQSGLWSRSLWSPADAGLQELRGQAAAPAGQFVDAGWGLSSSCLGEAVRTAEEGW